MHSLTFVELCDLLDTFSAEMIWHYHTSCKFNKDLNISWIALGHICKRNCGWKCFYSAEVIGWHFMNLSMAKTQVVVF